MRKDDVDGFNKNSKKKVLEGGGRSQANNENEGECPERGTGEFEEKLQKLSTWSLICEKEIKRVQVIPIHLRNGRKKVG